MVGRRGTGQVQVGPAPEGLDRVGGGKRFARSPRLTAAKKAQPRKGGIDRGRRSMVQVPTQRTVSVVTRSARENPAQYPFLRSIADHH
jgi:hypothetical protein